MQQMKFCDWLYKESRKRLAFIKGSKQWIQVLKFLPILVKNPPFFSLFYSEYTIATPLIGQGILYIYCSLNFGVFLQDKWSICTLARKMKSFRQSENIVL